MQQSCIVTCSKLWFQSAIQVHGNHGHHALQLVVTTEPDREKDHAIQAAIQTVLMKPQKKLLHVNQSTFTATQKSNFRNPHRLNSEPFNIKNRKDVIFWWIWNLPKFTLHMILVIFGYFYYEPVTLTVIYMVYEQKGRKSFF